MLYVHLINQPFRLYTDASDLGLGAVLTQDGSEGEQPVFYMSRKLTSAEQKYVVIEREALAIRWAIEACRYYLFTVITDLAPLQWLNRMKDINPRLMRWFLTLQPFTFRVVYRKVSLHSNADIFSRLAVWNTLDQQVSLEEGACDHPERTPLMTPSGIRGLQREKLHASHISLLMNQCNEHKLPKLRLQSLLMMNC